MPILDTDKLLSAAAAERQRKDTAADAACAEVKEANRREYEQLVAAVTLLAGREIPVDVKPAPPSPPHAAAPMPQGMRLRALFPNAARVSPPPPEKQSDGPPQDAGLTDLLRWAIRHSTAEFTAPSLVQLLESRGVRMEKHRLSVGSAMVKLVEKNEAVKVRGGTSRIDPTIYRQCVQHASNGQHLEEHQNEQR